MTRGDWRKEDKSGVQQNQQEFVDKGFAFVSMNYRFVSQVTVKEMMSDIANVLKWVHNRAKDHGGDPGSIFVAGGQAMAVSFP